MTISDTSAFVLHWTSKDIWKSKMAREYFDGLDLSSADTLIKAFNENENSLQSQSLSNRKFFVRKCVVEFLERCKKINRKGQVIILAAGIDPLSVEIASLYPESAVYDVDKYLMKEKEQYVGVRCPNINFIECDISDVISLKEKLMEKGWNSDQPTILVMEGISYYLEEDDLKKILRFFSTRADDFVSDFGMKPEYVDEKNRGLGVKICRVIEDHVGIDPMKCYSPDDYVGLVKQCGFNNTKRYNMSGIQIERTGAAPPFESQESSWVSLVSHTSKDRLKITSVNASSTPAASEVFLPQ